MNMSQFHTSGELAVAEDKKIQNKELKNLTTELKNIDVHGIHSIDMDAESAEVLEALNEDESFDAEIEQILANFDLETMDLTKLQTQIILLIKRHLYNLQSKNRDLKKILK